MSHPTLPEKRIERGLHDWFSREGRLLWSIARGKRPEEVERLFRGLAAKYPTEDGRYAAMVEYCGHAWPYGAMLRDIAAHLPLYRVIF